MKPVPFPEPYRTVLELAGGVFRRWGAPSGHDDEVAPTEACTYRTGVVALDGEVHRDQQVVTSVVIELEAGDLELISQTGMIEFGVWGEGMPVFFFNPLRSPSPEEWREFAHPFVVSEAFERIGDQSECARCHLVLGHEVHEGFPGERIDGAEGSGSRRGVGGS